MQANETMNAEVQTSLLTPTDLEIGVIIPSFFFLLRFDLYEPLADVELGMFCERIL